jgi:DNA-nicking Smr family endonuclease
VITGKGKLRDDYGPIPQPMGILRHNVPLWLRQMPLAPAVLQITESHAKHGGAGAVYVYLRRG